jgi:hypothetical protein
MMWYNRVNQLIVAAGDVVIDYRIGAWVVIVVLEVGRYFVRMYRLVGRVSGR